MKSALPGIIEKLLKISVLHSETLPDKIQVTRQKEVDFLQKITDRNGGVFILHNEVQTRTTLPWLTGCSNTGSWLSRPMALPLRQYVIYPGEKDSSMLVIIDSPGLRFEYKLVSLRELPYLCFCHPGCRKKKSWPSWEISGKTTLSRYCRLW